MKLTPRAETLLRRSKPNAGCRPGRLYSATSKVPFGESRPRAERHQSRGERGYG
jgi:hypothetical protein